MNKSMVGGFLLGLGIPVAMVAGLLVAPASQAATTYTAADVAAHNSSSDCWTVVGTGVYNVTAWIALHPGGPGPILGMCGGDGTVTYRSQHANESSPATALARYRIGDYVAPVSTPTPTPSPTTPGGTTPAYSATDVAAHRTAADCWVAISGNVYNLTNFASTHSGGPARITAVCGTDGTSTFLGQHSSTQAAKLTTLAPYKIGTYSGGAVATSTPTPAPTGTTPATSYTLAQVATHNTAANCWVAISGNVYNLTAFAPTHSGGAARITAVCGTDGTSTFLGQHSSTQAAKLTTLAAYKVGTFSGGVAPSPTPTTPSTAYTLAQVATHNTAANCWVIVSTNVYNLTAFAPTHSGGAARITALCGKDGTSTFQGQHASTQAAKLSILATYKVGTYSGGGTPATGGSYTLAQVGAHNKTTDCWVALVGNVYDLTAWKSTHSGGQSIIDGVCGTDGTPTFYGKHASVAATKLAILDAYKIGVQSDYVPTALPAPVTIDALVGGGEYTMDEVKLHSTASDCWTVIGDGVYGLSTWIPVHPGGQSVITAMCGIDATGMYSGKHGGSASAGAILAKIRIGTLVASKAKPVVTYTTADVAKHATASDCWSIVNGNVYDLTAWIPKHPGGPAVIIAMCGTDGTAMYTGKHGTKAGPLAALNAYQIGALAASATESTTSASGPIVTLIPARRVMAHDTARNCWTIVNGNVYNLTPWTKRHQNRKAFINAMCGKNGSAKFNKATGGVAKSNRMLKRFLIGKVGKPASTSATKPTSTGTYTLTDVAAHKSSSSCWSAVNGNVYDLTKWIPLHPGGPGVITGMCGKDGSTSYNGMHKGSAKAAAALAQYLIGKLG